MLTLRMSKLAKRSLLLILFLVVLTTLTQLKLGGGYGNLLALAASVAITVFAAIAQREANRLEQGARKTFWQGVAAVLYIILVIWIIQWIAGLIVVPSQV